MKKWARVMYQPNLPLYGKERVTASKEHIVLSKRAAGEGMVLLKNENQMLPLKRGAKIALFGKGSFDYVKGGGGSGDVFTAYVRNLYEGFKELGCVEMYQPISVFYKKNVQEQYANGSAPGMTVEPELPDDLLKGAKAFAETALIVLSRFSGEGWDRSDIEYDNGEYNPWGSETSMPKIAGKIFPEGDFYLSKEEKAMIEKVKENFSRVVVVLNIGGVIDTSWIKNDDAIGAALLAWQGGMEGGLATAEILCGLVNPSGKLPDTFAAKIEDYPSTANFHESGLYVDYNEDIFVGYRYFETMNGARGKVCYPFGYGLSYTDFEVSVKKAWEEADGMHFMVEVTNTGKTAGKEVVQVYYSAPQGVLGKAARELGTFAKTRLLQAGESQALTLCIDRYAMASFDDLGKVKKSAYVLEKGTYQFYIGTSVQNAALTDVEMTVEDDIVVEQLASHLAPTSLTKRLLADGTYEELLQTTPHDPNECLLEKPKGGIEEGICPRTRGRDSYMLMHPFKNDARPLIDVVEGRMTMDEFLAQLDDEDLIHLLGGQPNTSVGNTFGFGNLPEFGVPNIMTEDGPAGVRLNSDTGVCTTAWPCATLLASTWDTELMEQVGVAGGEEIKENNLAVWLAPAINIHRNPYCGRNFEYYSEDPLLAGKIGAAFVRGVQSNRVAACVKHFACNNKETNRKHLDSRVSERALREIYLKAFEIIVKEADPWAIMSAYNVINGQRCSESHELLEDILRGEWGFNGCVTTDWWTRGEHYKEIKAGNDIKMACGYPERVMEAMKLGALDRSDLERCAARVLGLICKID